MAVRLRLRRMGRKKRPFYRIVAADQRSPRDGRFIENLGHYDPIKDPHEIELDADRICYWLENGAQPSNTVKSLLKQKGIILRLELQKLGKSEDEINTEMQKWELQQIERAKNLEAKKARKKEKSVKPVEEETESTETPLKEESAVVEDVVEQKPEIEESPEPANNEAEKTETDAETDKAEEEPEPETEKAETDKKDVAEPEPEKPAENEIEEDLSQNKDVTETKEDNTEEESK